MLARRLVRKTENFDRGDEPFTGIVVRVDFDEGFAELVVRDLDHDGTGHGLVSDGHGPVRVRPAGRRPAGAAHLHVGADRAPRDLDPDPAAERREVGSGQTRLEGLPEVGDKTVVEVREDLQALQVGVHAWEGRRHRNPL